MTVEQLIQKLMKFPEDLLVTFDGTILEKVRFSSEGIIDPNGRTIPTVEIAPDED